MESKKKICAWCYFARMRRDICGIYCTGGFENLDGTCEYFKDYQEHKRQLRKMRRQTHGI